MSAAIIAYYSGNSEEEIQSCQNIQNPYDNNINSCLIYLMLLWAIDKARFPDKDDIRLLDLAYVRISYCHLGCRIYKIEERLKLRIKALYAREL